MVVRQEPRMTHKQHLVRLTPAQRAELGQLISRTGASAHTQRRARILLLADAGVDGPHHTDAEVAAAVLVAPKTVARTRSDFVTRGLDAALARRPRSDRRPRKLEGAAEARLIALTCSEPPPGQARWTLRLLSSTLVALEIVDGVSPETVRTALKKTACGPGWSSNGA
jgi:hypothetical protein